MTTSTRILGLLLVAFLVGGAAVAQGFGPVHPAQTWTGDLVLPDDARLGLKDIEIKIKTFSTDEEIQKLAATLEMGGQQALRQEMFRLEQKAWVRIGRSAATSVGVVRFLQLPDGKRRLRVFSDQPARLLDRSDPAGSPDHPFAYIELIVDEKGEGQGKMIAAASLAFTEDGLSIASAGAPVIEISNVRLALPPTR
jgi:hypothetical protein